MDIGNVLSRAWQTIWKHKILWIFGILAGCGTASTSGGSNTGFSFSGEEFSGYNLNLTEWQAGVFFLALMCIGLIFIFLVIFLGAIGRIGLVRGTHLVDGGREKLNFGALFNESMPYFWRVFGLSILIFILVLFIGIPIGIITCGLGFLAMAIVLPALVELSVAAIVVDDEGVFDSLKRGWNVYKDNIGTMILLWLILYLGLGLVIMLIVGIPLALLFVPIASGLIIGTDQSSVAGLVISGICFVAFLPVLLVIAGIVRAYVTSAWTLTYLDLTGQSASPSLALPPEAPGEPQAPEAPVSPEPPEEPESPESPEEPDEPLPDPL